MSEAVARIREWTSTVAATWWWVELAILPFALVSIPILIWCYRRWGEETDDEQPPVAGDVEDGDLGDE